MAQAAGQEQTLLLMTMLWFLVPVHGRIELTRVCLRQLRRTCDELREKHGIEAHAMVVGDDENLDTAAELDFGRYIQRNQPLGRKWNDAYQAACQEGQADFVVPLGSDDWVQAEFIAGLLPEPDQVRCSRLSSVVREDGQKLARLRIPYSIGDGVRVMPRALLEPLRFRPVVEHKPRAIDTSVMENIQKNRRVQLLYHDTDAFQIVDWKSREQLNSYARCLVFRDGDEVDPWEALAGRYPAEALDEMRAVYAIEAVTV
jgi:hypothetical protein